MTYGGLIGPRIRSVDLSGHISSGNFLCCRCWREDSMEQMFRLDKFLIRVTRSIELFRYVNFKVYSRVCIFNLLRPSSFFVLCLTIFHNIHSQRRYLYSRWNLCTISCQPNTINDVEPCNFNGNVRLQSDFIRNETCIFYIRCVIR